VKLKYDDNWHTYYLDGNRCTGATSIASYPEDKYLINKWTCRMALTGGAQKPELMERVAAHIDDRHKLNDLVEEAIEAAKANEARERGTAIHRLAERIDLGEQIVDTPLARQVQDTWKAALDDASLTVDTGYVERIVVYPDLYIAGTFDRIVASWDTGQLYIADIKTGPNAVNYPHPTAIQLAIYANAPLLAAPLPKGGGTTTQFDPMPPVNKDIGFIIHMPEERKAEVVPINIAAGWEAFNDICIPIQKWRRRKDLIQHRISAAAWAPKPRLVTEDGAVEPSAATVVPVPSTTLPGDDGPVDTTTVTDPAPVSTARLHWIQERCRKIVDDGHGRTLMENWPDGVPIFRDGGPRDDTELLWIADACDITEAIHGTPFGTTDPDQPTTTKATKQQKEPTHEPV
jgi:predicted small metal-binding protein